MTINIIFFLSLLSCTSATLPPPRILPDTLVMRESFQAPGPDRTGNWWGRFDDRGCWWEGHNTWLVITDEALLGSGAHPLHWNAIAPEQPWFCLSPSQLVDLQELVDELSPPTRTSPYRAPVDRWTIVGPMGPVSLVQSAQTDAGEWAALTDYFKLLSRVAVWGQSPES